MIERKPPKCALAPRRHMGDFLMQTRGGLQFKVAVYVDAARVAVAISSRAQRSSSQRAFALGGGVLVEVLPESIVSERRLAQSNPEVKP